MSDFDFSSNAIQASGIGRKDIRNALLYGSGLVNQSEFKTDDYNKIMSFKIQ